MIKEFFSKEKILLIMLVLSFIFLMITGFLVSGRNKPTPPQPLKPITNPENKAAYLSSNYTIISYRPLTLSGPVSTSPTLTVVFDKDISNVAAEIKLTPTVKMKNEISNNTLTSTPVTLLNPNTTYTATVYLDNTTFFAWEITTIAKTMSSTGQTALPDIKKLMPYQGDGFRITYSPTLDQFTVTISVKPVDSQYQKALAWFKNMGINDLSGIKISQFLVGQAAQP